MIFAFCAWFDHGFRGKRFFQQKFPHSDCGQKKLINEPLIFYNPLT